MASNIEGGLLEELAKKNRVLGGVGYPATWAFVARGTLNCLRRQVVIPGPLIVSVCETSESASSARPHCPVQSAARTTGLIIIEFRNSLILIAILRKRCGVSRCAQHEKRSRLARFRASRWWHIYGFQGLYYQEYWPMKRVRIPSTYSYQKGMQGLGDACRAITCWAGRNPG